MFLSLSANINAPEDYLVSAYVHALKQGIGILAVQFFNFSVQFFSSRSMHQVKLLARTEETFLQWKAQKADEQSKQNIVAQR